MTTTITAAAAAATLMLLGLTAPATANVTSSPGHHHPSGGDDGHCGGCQPWGGPGGACARDHRLDMRLAMDLSPENAEAMGSPVATFGLCPKVDTMQAFGLGNSALFAGGINATGEMTNATGSAQMWVYGMGDASDPAEPGNESDARVTVFERHSAACGGDAALVSFLVLNLTLDDGLYKPAPHTGVLVQAGFQPTCNSRDECELDSSLPCIGHRPGRRNCGHCIHTTGVAAGKALRGLSGRVWASYYGTDADGRVLRSGASSPINFRQFTVGPVLDKLKSALAHDIL